MAEETIEQEVQEHPADMVIDHSQDEVEPEPVIETPVEEVETPEPIDEALLKQAADSGLTKAQIDGLDEGSLRRVVRKLDPQITTASDATLASDAAKSQDEAKSGKQFSVKVPEDTYETELIEGVDDAIDRLATDTEAKLSRSLEQVKKLMADSAVREEREARVRFDSLIDGLGSDYQDEFGKETPTKTQRSNREDVRTDMRVTRNGRESEGLPSLNDEQLLSRALSSLHPDKNKQLAREEITEKLKTRKKQIISKPTNSKGPRKSGSEVALANIAETMAGFGANSTAGVLESDTETLKHLIG